MPLDLSGGYQTGADGFTVQQDGAGATVTGVAADFGSHQSEMFAQDFGKPLHGRDRWWLTFVSIDRKRDGIREPGRGEVVVTIQRLSTQASRARQIRVSAASCR